MLHASHTVIAHSVVAPATWSGDEPGGHPAPVLQVADRALGDGGDAPRVDRGVEHLAVVRPAGAGATCRQAIAADGDPHDDAVDPGDRGDRQVEAAGLLVAGVRAGAGDDGAGDDGQRRSTTTTQRTARRVRGTTDATRRPPSGWPARDSRTTALATSTIDSRKWPCTASGCRSTSTVIPPSTIWPITPATSPSDSHVRSRRRGLRHQRAEHGDDHGDGDQPGEQPVDLLDRRVLGADVDELARRCSSASRRSRARSR